MEACRNGQVKGPLPDKKEGKHIEIGQGYGRRHVKPNGSSICESLISGERLATSKETLEHYYNAHPSPEIN